MSTDTQTPAHVPGLQFLSHMLGATSDVKRARWGYRNHYSAGPLLARELDKLVDAGLCVRHKIFPDSTMGLRYYSATAAGCAAAGLDAAATRRAAKANSLSAIVA